jgi:hypothetical protein
LFSASLLWQEAAYPEEHLALEHIKAHFASTIISTIGGISIEPDISENCRFAKE